jgi:aspartate carbamoyltransferase regulatory subunit
LEQRHELYVKKIRDGTVIDHISAGYALTVLNILGIDGRSGQTVSIAMNVPSAREGRKDIVKVEGKELLPKEVDKIALIAPKATINIIRDYEVAKKERVELPQVVKGIVRCDNPSCVSNAREPVEATFQVMSRSPLRIRCHYCGRVMDRDHVLKRF